MTFDRIAVLGAGAWGSALANVAARTGRRVTLWTRDPKAAKAMMETRESPRLPGVTLAIGIEVTSDMAQAARADAALIVVPAQALREVALTLGELLPAGTPVIACAKGIERGIIAS